MDYAALKESHTHLQKTAQHLEREVSRRKEKEAELLTFSDKMSSLNAELRTERDSLEQSVTQMETKLKKEINNNEVIEGQLKEMVLLIN